MSQNIKHRIISITITTIISLVIAICVAWFQNRHTDRQMRLAEGERARNLYTSFVSVVEEHIINETPIGIRRVKSMIDTLKWENNVGRTKIVALDVFKSAEFNILKSRYLDIDKKEKCKSIFDAIYKDYVSLDSKYSDSKPPVPTITWNRGLIRERKVFDVLESLQKAADGNLKTFGGKR